MSVERSSVSNPAKPTAKGETGHIKGKALAAAGLPAADTGGFASLLLTLGCEDAGALVPGSDTVVPTLAPTPTPTPTPPDKALLPDAELLLAQVMQLQTGLPKADVAPANAEPVSGEAVLSAGRPVPSRDLAVLRSRQDNAAQDAFSLVAAKQDANKPPVLGDVARDAMVGEPVPHGTSAKSQPAPEDTQPGKSRLFSEQLAQKLLHGDSNFAQSAALPQMTLAAGASEPGFRQTERATERLAHKQIGGSESGAWGHQALLEAGRIDAPAATTGATALSPEMMVAEQVNYWIGRDVQNAEIKFDGLGDGAVKVNISLNGNEARVDFRSDQIETRQVLEGAVSHLKDLLGREGLVLSSVSVGTSGSGDAEAKQERPPRQSRQLAVVVPAAAQADSVRRPAHLSGRTVDLFV